MPNGIPKKPPGKKILIKSLLIKSLIVSPLKVRKVPLNKASRNKSNNANTRTIIVVPRKSMIMNNHILLRYPPKEMLLKITLVFNKAK